MGTPRAGSPATPVTGDRYLDLLVRFVERNAGALLDGTVTLRLHPVGLHYVASRLEALRELEAVGAGAPVDYLRAYVADLGDHRALEQLRRILRLLTSLKVVTPGPGRDPAPLSLLPFARLRVLELRGCDLSTSAARGLLDLRHTLERLVCFNSTDALRHVFASRIMDIKDSPVWSKLSYVSCASNGVVLMDESLQLLPAIEILDLSRNKFAKVDNLQKCTKLRTLDLGFNHLRSISSLSEVSSRIVKLVVRNNALTTVNGIENLKSLMGLDLSYNIISNFSELEMLGTLSLLQNLWLEGNPICCARWYRAHVFSFFRNPENLKLDDKGMNTQEYWEKQVLFACRQNQPAGYGFYFPAIDDHEDEDEDLLNMKMRRISRLASIVEEERNLCDEGVEQQSTHCDSDSSKKDETAAVDHDIRIASLINTAELLKKQKSSNWLREFKEWMDDNTEKTEGDNLSVDLTNGNGKYIRQKKKQKAHKKTSNSMSDLVQVSEGGSSSNLLESDSSFTDNGFSGSNGVIKQSSNELNFDQDHLNFNSFQRPAPLELVATSQTDPFSELENGSRNMLANGTPSNTMSKLIESSPPHTYSSPQSPPQYKEDILHRRLFLEEEFLEISGHLHSVGSLGSGSSCSDGSSSDYGSCISEDDCEKIQTKMELPINGQMVLFPSVNGDDHEAKNKLEHFSGENTLSDHPEEGEPSCSDHREFDIKEFHDNNQRNGHLGHYLGHLIGQKGKEKFKWRVFPFKNRNGTKLEIPKMNGDQVVAEHVLVEGNGQLTCNPSESTHKEGSKSHSSNILHKKNSSIGTNIIPRNTGEHKTLEDFFNMEIANKDGSETCEQVACCAYMVQDSSGLVQREVALLRSSQNKLYMLLLDMVFDGQETMPSILGSYSLESLEKVSIGLGLQALRVHMSDDTTHLFFTRTSKEAQDVLWLLSVTNFPKLNHKIHFQSWENIQVKLFEKCIIPRTANMGIFLYSMLMFWRNDAEEDSLFIRSIFVIEGSILVCIEDLDQFGAIPYDSNPPYFSLDASCSISNIREVVMDQHNNKCLTLIFDNRKQGEIHNSIQNPQDKQSDEINTVHTWKLEWFSEEASLKFISVLKALYSTAAASSLPVKCIS